MVRRYDADMRALHYTTYTARATDDTRDIFVVGWSNFTQLPEIVRVYASSKGVHQRGSARALDADYPKETSRAFVRDTWVARVDMHDVGCVKTRSLKAAEAAKSAMLEQHALHPHAVLSLASDAAVEIEIQEDRVDCESNSTVRASECRSESEYWSESACEA